MYRNASLDWLKLILSLLVIAIHCHLFKEQHHLVYFLSVNGICRIAVPLFLIINGYYFQSALQSGNWRPWIKRAAMLYFTWMIIYAPFWHLYAFTNRPVLNMAAAVLFGYQHLWYLAAVVFSAILLAILNHQTYLHLAPPIALLFMVGVAMQYVGNYQVSSLNWVNELCNTVWIHRSGLFFAFPLFFAGAAIQKHHLTDMLSLKHSLYLSGMGLFAVMLESYFNAIHPRCEGGFDNFLSLPLAAIPIFIMTSKMEYSGNSRQISLFSSAIYLSHPFIKDLIQIKTHVDGTALTLWVMVASALVSWLILKLNGRIKNRIKPIVIL